MDSPINIGDITTNSIQQRLNDTTLNKSSSSLSYELSSYNASIYSSINSSIKCIQLNLKLNKVKDEIIILRRVQDSYINITQVLSILTKLNLYTLSQIDVFMRNEIISNLQYNEYNSYLDLSNHANHNLRGIWIPYDKAVEISIKCDLYELIKQLFLIDVHDFENLTRINNKRNLEEDNNESSILESPLKKQKVEYKVDYVSKYMNNQNYPFTEPSIVHQDENIINEMRSILGEIFKRNESEELTFEIISSIMKPTISKYSSESVMDITLDSRLSTGLHFSGILGSLNLISSFIKLGICSPIRGNVNGESPLISCIQVRNSMDLGNFYEILSNWFHPNIFLFDNLNLSVLHHLVSQINDKDDVTNNFNFEISKYYTTKLIEYLISNDSLFIKFKLEILNSRSQQDGNTSLHYAIEKENKWFIKLLLKLGADVNISNKRGIKPTDFQILKEIINEIDDNSEEELLFDLIDTKVEFLSKQDETSKKLPSHIEEPKYLKSPERSSAEVEDDYTGNSARIINSIQQLISTTSYEYEEILNTKRFEIKKLNQLLHDQTIMTANNKFTTKKVSDNLIQLDNLKLQIANLSDKLLLTSQELNLEIPEDKEFDADEPFIIKPIYEKLINNEKGNENSIQEIESLKNDPQIMTQINDQTVPILKARIQAYKNINYNLENELKSLIDYNELTSKFKKVVSICTNVDINEVDELLDGLLEAVETQQ